MDYDAIVIGGGFFGACLAQHLGGPQEQRVTLLESGPDLLQRASYVNQARVHNGYHYPRSILTGLRSRVNFSRFCEEFPECVTGTLDSYYAVGRRFSAVTAAQFRIFCDRIGAPVARAPERIRKLFDPGLVEDVFRVTEFAFDAARLKDVMIGRLAEAGVDVRLETAAERVAPGPAGLSVRCDGAAGPSELMGKRVYNCTYSRLNRLPAASGLPRVRVKHEIAEMVLIEAPPAFDGIAVTIMCGPFFGVLPFPARGVNSLYHVRYAVHAEWHDEPEGAYVDPHGVLDRFERRSQYVPMIKDAARYIPCLAESRYVDSLWEVRTVLPRSEMDDSRPILFLADHGAEGFTSIVGGKMDNVYDMLDFVSKPES